MNREILFRGKATGDGQWLYGDLRRYSEFTCIYNDVQGTFVDPETVGEYTGLTDKNGTKVFEGDIVNLHYFYEAFDSTTYGAYEAEKEIIAVIAFGEMGLVFESN